MKVYKFGGASVSTYTGVQNVARIIGGVAGPLTVIVSAMGKTTNALEKVAEAFYAGQRENALLLFVAIKQQHLNTVKYLLNTRAVLCEQDLTAFFTELDWLLHDKPVRSYDYYYDQIVCIGELMSTCIVAHYLNEQQIDTYWVDVRDLLRTDNVYRNANVDWEYSRLKIAEAAAHAGGRILLTQGFIGATDENESTTLGREGSDYTASIFSYVLNAQSMTIWKDVAGVMSADPKKYPEAILLSELSFAEVIEMAYYGAQVIHPKTIKPIENKGIPLLVKCFLDTSLPGTTISAKGQKNLPPIVIQKANQLLITLTNRDFSFINESTMGDVYNMLNIAGIQPSLIYSTAISIQLCIDDARQKVDTFAAQAGNIFEVQLQPSLELLTIRHYTPEVIERNIAGRRAVFIQQSPVTYQQLSHSDLKREE